MEPYSLVGGMGEGSWSNWGLAYGLKDQRLMARPPARAGGRRGLLTVGESGKPNGYSLPSPKGYLLTSPARPAGGRAVTSVTTRGPQARYPVRSTAFPPRTHQRRGSRGRNLLPRGFFPPFLPKKWGPGWASQGSLPFQRRWKHPTTAPNLNTRRNLSSTTEDATHMIESLPWYHPRYSFHTSNRGAALFDNPFHEAILFLSGVYGKVQPHSTSHQQIPDSILQKCRFSHNLRYSFCLLLSKKVVCLYRVMPRGGLCKLYP